MNNKELHEYIIDEIDVPVDKLMAREKAAMLQAKRRRITDRTVKRSLLAACGLCLTILGSGFFSSGAAKALSKVPVIGPIYEQFSDIASEKIQNDQLASVIDKQDSRNGLTMTVKDAAYDGGRLIVTVAYEGEKQVSLEEETVGFTNITINGREVEAAIGSSGQDMITPSMIIEHHQFTLTNYDEFGDHIDVSVQGENLFGLKGKWKVDFPLEKIKGDIHEFYPEVKGQTKDNKYTLATDKITFSELSTRIDLTLDYPVEMDKNDTWPWFDYIVIDDKGNIYDRLKLQVGIAGEYGRKVVLVLPPMDKVPKSLTIKTIDNTLTDDVENRDEIEGLELFVPLIPK
ncbi:DUF4179 domain-containing protein [Siminovitchia acidinfaciens]|uniref:DUF4179 domain-containing protein n=1 Tax=Siminovitchia acidinfaciens TaxID=2321395 RepID=A0A429Y211_9BACI|nr:DUF4179 domain-containing protein [Siminovitchia acidinfaciens]RST75282.1 DUF4179 domain-containing protein [Siminovitchia acidinfaciens]